MAELIHCDTFFFFFRRRGGEGQREEMRKGCDLQCSDPFILSLNLIGVAQLAPYIEYQVVSNDSSDFPCRFMRKSEGVHVSRFGWIEQNGSL